MTERHIGHRRALEWIRETEKSIKRLERKICYRIENNRSIEDVLPQIRDCYRMVLVLRNVVNGKSQIVGQPKFIKR